MRMIQLFFILLLLPALNGLLQTRDGKNAIVSERISSFPFRITCSWKQYCYAAKWRPAGSMVSRAVENALQTMSGLWVQG